MRPAKKIGSARLLVLAIVIWLGLADSAIAQTAAAIREQVEASMLVIGSVDIESDGRVAAHALDHREELPPFVVGLIAKRAPAWRFEPVLVGGEPTKVRTPMSLRVTARRAGEDYVVKIASAHFGGAETEESDESLSSVKMTPPKYPYTARSIGAKGTVYLVVQVGRDGTVAEVVAEQVNLRVVGDGPQMTHMRDVLVKAALTAARRWRFRPPVRGEFADKEYWLARVPVDFSFADEPHPGYGEWSVHVPGPRLQNYPWHQEKAQDSFSPDALASGAVYMVDDGLALLTPLDGA